MVDFLTHLPHTLSESGTLRRRAPRDRTPSREQTLASVPAISSAALLYLCPAPLSCQTTDLRQLHMQQLPRDNRGPRSSFRGPTLSCCRWRSRGLEKERRGGFHSTALGSQVTAEGLPQTQLRAGHSSLWCGQWLRNCCSEPHHFSFKLK